MEVTLSQKPAGSWVRDVEVRLKTAQEKARAAEARIDVVRKEGERKGREASVQRQRAKIAEERVKVFKAQASAAERRAADTQLSLEEAREEWSKQQAIIGKLKSGFQLQTKAAQEAHGSQFESLNAEKEEFTSSIRKLTFEKETLADMKDMALTKIAAVQHKLDLAIKAHGTFPVRLQESLQLAELLRSEAKASDDEIARLKTELGQAKADHASSIRSLSSQLRNVESVAEQAAESMFDKAPPYVASLCGCQHRHNGKYLGSYPLKNNQPSSKALWKAIGTLNEQQLGKIFDVTVVTIAGHMPQSTYRNWPKMLVMATQTGKFSLAVPYDKILSIGTVGTNVIVVCWTRANDQRRSKKFLLHAVEFEGEEEAVAMSQTCIMECEKLHHGKGVEKVIRQESVGKREKDGSGGGDRDVSVGRIRQDGGGSGKGNGGGVESGAGKHSTASRDVQTFNGMAIV